MSKKVNCWEYKKCGREAGGSKVAQMGVCPASSLEAANGFCGGKNGGRACAYVAGTFCGGNVQGTAADKSKNCGECDFYRMLKSEHHGDLSVFRFTNYIRAATGAK